MMPAWPTETGDFGRIGPNSHWIKMVMPSPLVCKQRIQEGLRLTGTPGVREWNLPPTLAPADAGAGTPTRNCLGWARAATLTNNQVAFLETNIMETASSFRLNSHVFSTTLTCMRKFH